MDAEVESVMASSQDQREEELQVIITRLSQFRGPITTMYIIVRFIFFFQLPFHSFFLFENVRYQSTGKH